VRRRNADVIGFCVFVAKTALVCAMHSNRGRTGAVSVGPKGESKGGRSMNGGIGGGGGKDGDDG